jgi:[ribosomal protein S5]-alanine N-acetyltransferase
LRNRSRSELSDGSPIGRTSRRCCNCRFTPVRPLTPEDAAELAGLLIENREFLAPFEPARDERFFTVEGQRERIESDEGKAFAILDAGRIAGTVAISNVVHGPFQSANLGYWVAERLNGRGLATAAVGEVVEVAFGPLGLHRLEAATLVPRDSVCSRRTASSGSGSLAATCSSPASGATTCCSSKTTGSAPSASTT